MAGSCILVGPSFPGTGGLFEGRDAAQGEIRGYDGRREDEGDDPGNLRDWDPRRDPEEVEEEFDG